MSNKDNTQYPFLALTGQVMSVFTTDAGVGKDGEKFDASDRVQILGNRIMPNGSCKLELETIKVSDKSTYESLIGKHIRVPVSIYAAGRGTAIISIVKGAVPEVLA